MTRLRYILLTLLAAILMPALLSAKEATVSATYTYYGAPDDCKRKALEGARLQAIASEFGTVLTQDVVQHDVVSREGESTYFSVLNATEVKGEWIADEGEPVYDVSLDSDGHMVVRCTVRGRARSISNEAVDFETLVLRNGTDRKHADTAFRSDDRFALLLKTPVDGYVSVFLVDQQRNTYALLPYMLDPNGEVKVKKGREYIFFDKSKADKSYDVQVDELKLTAEQPVEYYRVYVVFSPNRFSGPLRDFVDSRFPSAHSSARKSLVHFIMTNMGYDIRIATSSTGNGLLLIPFRQHVYATPFAMIDGRRYYIFSDADVDLTRPENRSFSTCKIPADLDAGKDFDLLISNLRLPEIPQSYSITDGNITLSGRFNRAVIPLLYRYPQMETGDYARCNVLPGVREELVKQLRQQLAGMPKEQAVNKLLNFVQNGFAYSTDEDFHGFEKPYFVEEMLFYPKNDCEDRAIFYTGLLWDALGVPNQLIAYPGHESAAVALTSQPEGCRNATSYTHSGYTFYISDPTYIGSVTGMCIPEYETTVPKIDYTYE